jgi:hypothetical protein
MSERLSGHRSIEVDPSGISAWEISGVPLGLLPVFWNGSVPGPFKCNI